jgi:hypothetical protein
METLYNLVTYNHQLYGSLTDEKDRKILERLIVKLQYLEHEILHETEGSINISPGGSVFVRNYPLRLHRKINQV